MRCPYCGADDTQVKDSRPTEDSAVIRRRRVCLACNFRFTTFERVQLRELTVIKRNGRRDSVVLATKVHGNMHKDDKLHPAGWGNSRYGIIEQCHASLTP